MTIPAQPLHRAVEAGRAGDLDAVRALVDWGACAAALVANLEKVRPEIRARAVDSGLAEIDAAEAGAAEMMADVVRPLSVRLGMTREIRLASPAVRDRLLATLRVPDRIAEGPRPDQLARLAELRDRVRGIRDVYIIDTGDDELPVAVTPGGRLAFPVRDERLTTAPSDLDP